MQSIDKSYRELYEINKSKFYSFAYPVFSELEVKARLSELREKYADATHICFAYILDTPRQEKASDDGEPSGTAGKPMLELLKKKNLSNILLVVIRYFGGIKLGAGGLVRAYTNSSNLVLTNANIVEYVTIKKYRAVIDLSMGAKLQNIINSLGCEILNCKYEDKTYIEYVGDITERLKELFKDIDIIETGSELKCR